MVRLSMIFLVLLCLFMTQAEMKQFAQTAEKLEYVDGILLERAASANEAWNNGVLYVKTITIVDTTYVRKLQCVDVQDTGP